MCLTVEVKREDTGVVESVQYSTKTLNQRSRIFTPTLTKHGVPLPDRLQGQDRSVSRFLISWDTKVESRNESPNVDSTRGKDLYRNITVSTWNRERSQNDTFVRLCVYKPYGCNPLGGFIVLSLSRHNERVPKLVRPWTLDSNYIVSSVPESFFVSFLRLKRASVMTQLLRLRLFRTENPFHDRTRKIGHEQHFNSREV